MTEDRLTGLEALIPKAGKGREQDEVRTSLKDNPARRPVGTGRRLGEGEPGGAVT
ncbi:hypothetical protein [Streptomyces sp. NPDC048481]|uniref:hypothetical protein n=1 Tax=Streptomyces sp. NPDC048481 TaxID=3365557 RepID=UPI00371A8037